jgi:hypothetical protein
MNRWLLGLIFMVLVLGLGTAQAAWTYMGHLDGNSVLIDRDSIVLKKRNALVWMLTNYSTVTSQQLLSSTTHLEFDCDKNKVRYLQIYGYEGQMQSARHPSVRAMARCWADNSMARVLSPACAQRGMQSPGAGSGWRVPAAPRRVLASPCYATAWRRWASRIAAWREPRHW